MDPLVSAGWLAANIDDPRLRMFDATLQVRRRLLMPVVRSGRHDWRQSHIPGARSPAFSRSRNRTRRSSRSRCPRLSGSARGPASSACRTDSLVVLYDRRENMWAARLWWMLRAFGFDNAVVLDGGWTAWGQAGYAVCDVPCTYPPAEFHAAPRPRLVADKEEVLAAIDDPRVCLVNALGRRQHRGEVNEYARRGHIPGSRNVTAWEVLDRHSQRYRPLPELRRKVGPVLDAERVITYCGAGVAASSLALVLVHLGHPDVAVYDGGLMEWCADGRLPLETGSC